jgi:carbohydrate binding protein with CBM11 domain
MNSKMLLTVALMLSALLTVDAVGEPVTIADFNSSSPTNNLGGSSGSFSGEKPENICKIEKTPAEKHGSDGASLQVDYNVGEEGSYNGFWMKLGADDAAFDASKFKKLTFWIKGSATMGIPTEIKCELKSGPDKSGVVYVGDITSEWQKKEFNLAEFSGQGIDLAHLIDIFMVFEQRKALPRTTGTIYVDDFKFE